MTTSPFQSIKDAVQQQSNRASTPASDECPETLEDIIGSLFAKPASAHAAAPPSNSNSYSSVVSTAAISTPALARRPPLQGGVYSETDALALLNAHYFVGKSNHETSILRINDDGTVSFVPTEQFKLEVAHILVQVGGRWVRAEKFWRESPLRHEKVLVFKPGGTARHDEYNLWRGFGIEPHKGWQKQRRFLRHLRRLICRRDKGKFKYLMQWLAWAVQNPDKHAGVVLVLKSREQGTGKSTVGKVMRDIFGQHGVIVDDKDRLLGRFNDWLETACFILAEEILFAGDLKSADKMKSMVTTDLLPIERKYGSVRQAPSRMKVIATTNHEHAIAAGVRDRRNVVYEVSNERVGDTAYFDEMYGDLADGGSSEFLWLLQNLKLGDWHPRMTIRTEETTEQQRMSGDSVSQWSQACIYADEIAVSEQGAHHDLNSLISFPDLLSAYSAFCRKLNHRAVGPAVFGKACADMFGPRRRLPAAGGNKRPWAYHVPAGPNWQQEVDKRLGVK